jgi:hypothetical protein
VSCPCGHTTPEEHKERAHTDNGYKPTCPADWLVVYANKTYAELERDFRDRVKEALAPTDPHPECP